MENELLRLLWPMGDMSQDQIEIEAVMRNRPYSWSPDGHEGPPRVDVRYCDSGIECISLDQAGCDTLIDALTKARTSVWGTK